MQPRFYTLTVTALISACAAPPEGVLEDSAQNLKHDDFIQDDFRLGIRVEVAPDRKPTWVGHRLGLSPGRKWYRGRLRSDPGGTAFEPTEVDERPEMQLPNTRPNNMVTYDHETGEVYEVELPEDALAALTEVLEAAGYARGRGGQEVPDHAESPEFEEKEWGGNTDNRSRLGIADTNLASYNKIGEVTSGCTGTIVGTPDSNEEFIVMAAHCLFNSGGAYLDPNFRPRRDGTGTPSGSIPYGTWDGYNWIGYQYFMDNCIGQGSGGTSITTECVANDILMQRVGRPGGQSTIGAYGFGVYSVSTLNSISKWHRGYPVCGTGGPSPCTPNTLYGDGAMGSVTAGSGDRILYHSSDLNGGHSGGPLYVSDNGVKLFGVQSAQLSNCFGSMVSPCPPVTRPNMMRRIDSTFYGWMLDFIADYPN